MINNKLNNDICFGEIMSNTDSNKKKTSKILRILIVILLTLVSMFAVINLLTDNYVRDVTIKGGQPRKY